MSCRICIPFPAGAKFPARLDGAGEGRLPFWSRCGQRKQVAKWSLIPRSTTIYIPLSAETTGVGICTTSEWIIAFIGLFCSGFVQHSHSLGCSIKYIFGCVVDSFLLLLYFDGRWLSRLSCSDRRRLERERAESDRVRVWTQGRESSCS